MTRYQVFVDGSQETLEEGGFLAHVPALPGCVVRGGSRDDAVAGIPTAIVAFHAELRSHGRQAPPDDDLELEIIDTTDLTLPPDYAPLDRAALAAALDLAEMSRRRLLALLGSMPTDALDWRPDEGSWSPRSILAHLAGADLWYASRLEQGGLPELMWRLGATRDLLTRQLTGSLEHDGDAVKVHMGEEWTPRKVARRLLEHEQEHLAHLRAVLEQYARRG